MSVEQKEVDRMSTVTHARTDRNIGTVREAVAQLPRDTDSIQYRAALRDLRRAGWGTTQLAAELGVSRWRVGQLSKEGELEDTYIHDPVVPERRVRGFRLSPEPEVTLTDHEAEELMHLVRSAKNESASINAARPYRDAFAERVNLIKSTRGVLYGEIARRIGMRETTLRCFMARRGYVSLPPSLNRYQGSHQSDGDVEEIARLARRNPGEWILWPTIGDQSSDRENVALDRRSRFTTNPVGFGDDVQLAVDHRHVTWVRYVEGAGRYVTNISDPLHEDDDLGAAA